MKKLFIIIALTTSTFFTSTQSMLQICLGAGTTGLGYALYRETARDNTFGFVSEAFQVGAVQAGLGSPIEKLRFNIQNILRNVISKHRMQENAVDDFNFLLKVEKIFYCSTMLLGSISILYGLKDFFQK